MFGLVQVFQLEPGENTTKLKTISKTRQKKNYFSKMMAVTVTENC